MLTNFFRRLLGFQQLAEAQRQTRIALAMVSEAQQSVVASREPLAACRALLAVEVLARKVARLEQQRQRERQASRFWLTRTIEPQCRRQREEGINLTTIARITNPQRLRDWMAVFGTDTIPLRSPVPYMAGLPGLDDPQLVYDADLTALTPYQRRLLIIHIAMRFSLSIDYVARNLDDMGLPILAEDVTIISNDIGLVLSSMDDGERARASAVCDMTHHEWTEGYYGYRCDNCGLFIPFGCEPWAPNDDNESDARRELAAPDSDRQAPRPHPPGAAHRPAATA